MCCYMCNEHVLEFARSLSLSLCLNCESAESDFFSPTPPKLVVSLAALALVLAVVVVVLFVLKTATAKKLILCCRRQRDKASRFKGLLTSQL